MKFLIIKMGIAHSIPKNDKIGFTEPVREKRKVKRKSPVKRKVKRKSPVKRKVKRKSPVKRKKKAKK